MSEPHQSLSRSLDVFALGKVGFQEEYLTS